MAMDNSYRAVFLLKQTGGASTGTLRRSTKYNFGKYCGRREGSSTSKPKLLHCAVVSAPSRQSCRCTSYLVGSSESHVPVETLAAILILRFVLSHAGCTPSIRV